MRIHLDTNILARSAAGPPGLAHELVREATRPEHELLLSRFGADELRRVLKYARLRPMHGLSDEQIDQFVADLALVATLVDPPTDAIVDVSTDADDNYLIAAAVAGGAEVLCTLDRHLLNEKVKAYFRNHDVAIMTDHELLTQLKQLR